MLPGSLSDAETPAASCHQQSEFNVFKQDSVSVLRSCETVNLLTTGDFIPHAFAARPNSPDLSPLDYRMWSVMQEKLYKERIKGFDELRMCMLTAVTNWMSTLLMRQPCSGARISKRKAHTSNTN